MARAAPPRAQESQQPARARELRFPRVWGNYAEEAGGVAAALLSWRNPEAGRRDEVASMAGRGMELASGRCPVCQGARLPKKWKPATSRSRG